MAASDQSGGHTAVLAATNNAGFTTADLQADMLSQANVEIANS